ncbi:MAG: hydroxymethylglutaryl-CoA lyase [Deltaproteobacteria bacterium]|nr:MAG: hydroxymethylglutaryl-CoA lyase [Deltaproteobacteria bacterium]
MSELYISKSLGNERGGVTIVDVSARDGLQSASPVLSAARRASWVRSLLEAGVDEVEACSFVNPKLLPQMADAAGVLEELRGYEGRIWSLVPNLRGLELAVAAGAKNVVCLLSLTEAHSKANLGRDIESVLVDLEKVAMAGNKAGVNMRLSTSMTWVCPQEGKVPSERTIGYLKRARDIGFDKLTLCDTYGCASPLHVEELLALVSEEFNPADVGLHLHDTFGVAGANTLVALMQGYRRFEGSIGGLGGCPFAEGAKGNMDTIDMVYLLRALGYEVGVDMERLKMATGACLALV